MTTNFYKDLAQSGTALATPAALSLINSGYDLTVDELDTSQENCRCFQILFQTATIDVELEVYGFDYMIELRGEDRT